MFEAPVLKVKGNTFSVESSFALKDAIKTIPGRSWDKRTKSWDIPANQESLRYLKAIAPNAIIQPEVYEMLKESTNHSLMIANQKDIPWQEQTAIKAMPIRVNPFQHQVAAYNVVGTIFGLWRDKPHFDAGAGLYMEQGTGKTLVAIAVAGRMFLDGIIRRMLVVAPASVVPVWPKEFDEFANFEYEVVALEGDSKKKSAKLTNWGQDNNLQVAVVNYESSWRIEEAIMKWKPDLVVLDESQRIKNSGAKQSKVLHKIGKAVSFRMILTGTPVSQGPLDFFSQLKFTDPTILGGSYFAMKTKYAVTGGFEGRQIIGYKNLPELTQKVHSIGFRVTKDEALDLPEMLPPQIRYCEFEPSARAIYARLVKESVTELENSQVIVTQNALAKLLRLSQLSGGFYSESGASPVKVSDSKINLLEETLEDLGSQKVVIFARFLAEISAIKQLLERKGIRYQHIDGSVPMNQRGEVVREFQEDKNCQVFLAQIQTAGLGITLHASSVAIFYSLDYSYANLEQALARLHRIGQRNVVTNIFLTTRGTVDEKVLKAIHGKQDIAKLVVDNWKLLFEEDC